MSTSHSPGPWEWVGRDLESNFPGHYEAVIESTVSCGSFCYGGSVDMKVSDADRCLIAAAPDMLQALRRAVLALAFAAESSPAMRDDYEAVSAAIAKATGP